MDRPPAPPPAVLPAGSWTPAASWADALAPASSAPRECAARALDGAGRPLHLSARDASAAKTQSYRVRASKKGGIPVAIEKRKCGKKVVLIAGVEGDVAALLSDLKRALGAGGVVTYPDPSRRDRGTAEIQGERHLERVQEFLALSGCVVGLSKKAKEKALQAALATKAKLQRKSKGVIRGGGAKQALLLRRERRLLHRLDVRARLPDERLLHRVVELIQRRVHEAVRARRERGHLLDGVTVRRHRTEAGASPRRASRDDRG